MFTGKLTQHRQSSSNMPTEKSRPHKWVRMLHLLDYHRWHHVKKMLMTHHKKHGHDHQTRHHVAGDDSPSVYPSVSVRPRAKADLDCDPTHKEEKVKDPGPSNRGSAATRIKKLIAKEVSRRKGKHRRSSTCPAGPQLVRTGSTHHELDQPTLKRVIPGGSDFIPDQHILNDEINGKRDHDEDLPPILHKTSEDEDDDLNELPTPVKCELRRIRNMDIELDLGKKPMGEEEDDDEEQQEALNILKEMSSNSNGEVKKRKSLKNMGKSASSHQSWELLHAIEVLRLNKNFFLKVLEDPESSLAQHFLAQQQASDISRKRSLSKLGTFPLPGTGTDPSSSSSTDKKASLYGSSTVKQKQQQQEKMNSSKESTTDSSKHLHLDAQTSNSDLPPNNRRFKDLRQKIHHVIRESKDERRRIAMDAVLHKVPYGKKYSEDDHIGKEIQIADQISNRNSTMAHNISVSPNRSKNKPQKGTMKRSPSLDESLEKYSHLFRTSCITHHTPAAGGSAMSRLVDNERNNSSSSTFGGNAARKGLGRMFSSPDLQLYYSHHCEDPNALIASKKQLNKIRSSGRLRASSSSFNDDIPDLEASPMAGPEKERPELSQSQESYLTDDDQQLGLSLTRSQYQELVEAVEALQRLEILDVNHKTSDDDNNNDDQIARLNEPSLDDANQQQEATSSSSPQQHDSSLLPPDSSTSPNNNNFLHRAYLDTKDQADFDYVKDILRLSGYTENQNSGKWYSAYQPVNPSIFLELESLSPIQPNSSISGALSASSTSNDEHDNDEYGGEHDYGDSFNNQHLLLFDLINETLLSIHERSATYWPSSLTTNSKVRPMPKGYHVLEEVWGNVSWYLRSSPSNNKQQPEYSSMDYITMRDLAREDGWMNLQSDAECVGIEVEDLIFDDLLVELLSS